MKRISTTKHSLKCPWFPQHLQNKRVLGHQLVSTTCDLNLCTKVPSTLFQSHAYRYTFTVHMTISYMPLTVLSTHITMDNGAFDWEQPVLYYPKMTLIG